MNRWSEKLLVRRILAGDHEACVRLIDLHHAPIYGLLVHLCRDAHLAEDLTQETFIVAWAGLSTFGGTSSLRTWLHQIAYRKFIDSCRRRKPAPASLQDPPLNNLRADLPGPLDEVLADEQSRQLYRQLARLGADDRGMLVLHYLQGLSFRQMAQVLDAPVGTVKSWTNRALTNLRTLIVENDHGDERKTDFAAVRPQLAGGSIAAASEPQGA